MDTKDELVNHIKDWIQIDNEMKMLQGELKQRRLKKKDLTERLVETMKDNDIDCFNMKDGKLVYAQNKVKTPLSKKHLMTSLLNYFKDDEETALLVSKFIMESRETKLKDVIKHKQ